MNGLRLGHDGVEWALVPDHWCLVRREGREIGTGERGTVR